MKNMSEFISKLEGYSELEVSIIRTTKINKVLKAIIKLTSIPKEEEFKFKARSQTLLDKWNKLLASEHGTPAANTNGTSENKGSEDEKPSAPAATAVGEESKSDVAKTKEKDEVETKDEKIVEAPETKASLTQSKTETSEQAEKVPEVCDVLQFLCDK